MSPEYKIYGLNGLNPHNIVRFLGLQKGSILNVSREGVDVSVFRGVFHFPNERKAHNMVNSIRR